MTEYIVCIEAPTVAELAIHPLVEEALEQAWKDSVPADPRRRHEEGGWIYCDIATGAISIQRAPAGRRAFLNLCSPTWKTGFVVVATFHTYPNPIAEGWKPGPSSADEQSAELLGVPCLIRAEDGVHTTGPASRRGGLAGNPGFPE
jgi:hypothetical protein